MKRPELFKAFRERIDDDAQPYLWSDTEVQRCLDAAHREAAERAKLIRDSSTAAVCLVTITAPTAAYVLSSLVLQVERARLANQTVPLTLSSVEQMDRDHASWESATGAPTHLLVDNENNTLKVRLVPAPSQSTTLELVVFRLPLSDLNSDDDAPEIHTRYHLDLVHWMMHLAYLKRDSETYNEAKSAECAAAFSAVFGAKLDANVRRKQADRSPACVAFREF